MRRRRYAPLLAARVAVAAVAITLPALATPIGTMAWGDSESGQAGGGSQPANSDAPADVTSLSITGPDLEEAANVESGLGDANATGGATAVESGLADATDSTDQLSRESGTAAGVVRFMKWASTPFDSEDIEANGPWIRNHFERMVAWSPFFDSRTAWYPNAWMYQDAYAIYKGSELEKAHPEWILKDAQGRRLYIPYGSPPTQYAADITNPAFRSYWIARVKATLAKGYKGVFVDDVNMWANVGNASDEATPAIGVNGRPITDEAWRESMLTFMEELRRATQGYEIVHNPVWYINGGSANRGTTSPIVRSQMQAADVIYVERGVNDEGLTGGTGPWSVSNLLTYIDELHALGRSVVMAGEVAGRAATEYNLAAYFLVSDGSDYVTGGGDGQTVTNFWSGWSVNLGGARGPRYSWKGLLRRDFERGSVYLNPPDGKDVVVAGRALRAKRAAIILSR